MKYIALQFLPTTIFPFQSFRIVPRVIAIRGENARLQRGIPDENSESILKKVVMELIAIVREAETDIDGSEDRSNNKFFRSHSIAGSSNRREEENSAVLQSILKGYNFFVLL